MITLQCKKCFIFLLFFINIGLISSASESSQNSDSLFSSRTGTLQHSRDILHSVEQDLDGFLRTYSNERSFGTRLSPIANLSSDSYNSSVSSEDLYERLADANLKNTKLDIDLNEAVRANEALKQELVEQKQNSQIELNRTRSELKELRGLHHESLDKISENVALKDSIEKLRQENQILKERVSELQSLMAEQLDQNDVLTELIKEKDDKVASLTESNKQLNNLAEETLNSNEDQQEDLTQALEDLTEVTGKVYTQSETILEKLQGIEQNPDDASDNEIISRSRRSSNTSAASVDSTIDQSPTLADEFKRVGL